MTTKKTFIPYGTQWIGADEIANVVSVLEGTWLSPGPQIEAFEEAVAKYCGARYAVAYSSGTSALHGAVHAAGAKAGDEGITSPLSWVASANCLYYEGATPRFCDIDTQSMNLSPEKLREAISPRTKVVIPVHFAGLPCDMKQIHAISKEAGAVVIEDGAHAIGSSTTEGKIGNCALSDMTCFSFHPVKTITTGEGGMVTTNDPGFYESLVRFRNHGIVRNIDDAFPDEGPWYFEMDEPGYNYRMTNFQAAIGIEQMKRIDGFLDRRQHIRNAYDAAFKDLAAIECPQVPQGQFSAFHLYVVRLRLDRLTKTRKEIFLELREKGLGVHVHYPPIHLQPYFKREYGYKPGDFPVAEECYARSISLPIFPKMSDDDIRYVIDAVTDVIERAVK